MLESGPGTFSSYTSEGGVEEKPSQLLIDKLSNRLKEDKSLTGSGLAFYSEIEDMYLMRPISVRIVSGEVFLLWVVYLSRDSLMKEGTLDKIKKEISGQSSDGWGEGFEQTPIYVDTSIQPEKRIYFSPWRDNGFTVTLKDDEPIYK